MTTVLVVDTAVIAELRALDAGADDYVSKPFGMPEFLARLRAVLRRTVAAAGARENQLIDTGTFTVDLAAKKVWRDGSQVRLTPIEWALLEILIRHQGCLVPHRQLLTEVWGPTTSPIPITCASTSPNYAASWNSSQSVRRVPVRQPRFVRVGHDHPRPDCPQSFVAVVETFRATLH